MAQVSLPYQLTAGQPENVNQLMDNLNTLRNGINTIDTAQLSDGAITADKLGATLAGQLGITTTATARSVTVTQTAETTTTNTGASPATLATSSELTTSANGLLRIVIYGESKSSNANGAAYIAPEINDAGTYRGLVSGAGLISASATYSVGGSTGPFSAVVGTSYKKFAIYTVIPFISGGIESSAGKSQFRLTYYSSNASYTAYVKNLTATMTYIAV